MTMDLEEMAEQAAQEVEARPAVERLKDRPRDRIFQCLLCRGSGRERSKWGFLWGNQCWSCGGWGFHLDDPLVLRGPLALQPGRYRTQGGSDDAANSGNSTGNVGSDGRRSGDGAGRNSAG